MKKTTGARVVTLMVLLLAAVNSSTNSDKCATGALMGRFEFRFLFTSEDKLNLLISDAAQSQQLPKLTQILPHDPTHEVSYSYDGFCSVCTIENLSELCSKKKDCQPLQEDFDRLVLDLLVRAVNLDELKTPISDRIRLFDIPRGCKMRTRGNSKPYSCKPNWIELEKLAPQL